MAVFAARMTMIWINADKMPSHYFDKNDRVNRLGGFIGVMGQSPLNMSDKPAEINSGDRLTAFEYDTRIAKITLKYY